ncbi:unnamed protein product [Aphanomyces euteiches]
MYASTCQQTNKHLPPLHAWLPKQNSFLVPADCKLYAASSDSVAVPVATSRPLPSLASLLNHSAIQAQPIQPKAEPMPMGFHRQYESHSPTTSSSAASITDDNDDPALLEVPGQCLDPSCREPVKHRGFCKAHGGSRRCAVVGCAKGVQGGGKRCRIPDCNKATQSQGLCKAHGGGVRCKFEGCTKSSQGGGFCRRHGGGKRCSVEGCPRGAQRGSTCAQHGGKSRCLVDACERADRGGGFCEVHRRDKVCRQGYCNRLAKVQCDGFCAQHHRERFLNLSPRV